tara:strand:- start:153 stop:473 length:321 start_codon:yes stop_codon:yes gene_type:complete
MLDLSHMIPDMKTINTNPLDNVIIWNKKKYVMPFDADYGRQKADSFKEEIIVKNRFGGEPALLPWFAVAVYDVIMGSEQTQDWDNHRKGLDWFIKYFPKQYMVLLD